MTSNETYTEAFVWVWLPGETAPVVAGKLTAEGDQLLFNYGKSYLERPNAMAIYEPELPLKPGVLPLLPGLTMPGCIRDASPDAWGRRVIINRALGLKGKQADAAHLGELTYLLESGSDRIGALDFQRSATEYVPRSSAQASLDELAQSAERVEKGLPLSPELDQALQHGTSIGGARPKAQIESGDKKFIAKFSSATDLYSVVKAEFVAMRLAAQAGLNVAPVSLTAAMGKDVLLVERFDRVLSDGHWKRKALVSALTMLSLDEMMGRYASYEDLAELVRRRFTDAKTTLRELYVRLVFNVLCGNTDDHARNHAAFWDGRMLQLTPAYDICPQPRTGNEASQAMLIEGQSNLSRVSTCINAAGQFLLSREEATQIAADLLGTIAAHWDAVCDEASLSPADRGYLWGRQFLNPFAFEDLKDDATYIKTMADDARA